MVAMKQFQQQLGKKSPGANTGTTSPMQKAIYSRAKRNANGRQGIAVGEPDPTGGGFKPRRLGQTGEPTPKPPRFKPVKRTKRTLAELRNVIKQINTTGKVSNAHWDNKRVGKENQTQKATRWHLQQQINIARQKAGLPTVKGFPKPPKPTTGHHPDPTPRPGQTPPTKPPPPEQPKPGSNTTPPTKPTNTSGNGTSTLAKGRVRYPRNR